MSAPGEFTAGDVLAATDMNDLPGGIYGYAEVTTDQALTTEVDLTGLSVTVDVPAGRRIRVSASTAFSGSTSSQARVYIKETTTYLKRGSTSTLRGTSTAQAVTLDGVVILTPSSGSHTYKLAAEEQGGASITMRADADKPAYIMVEDLGPA